MPYAIKLNRRQPKDKGDWLQKENSGAGWWGPKRGAELFMTKKEALRVQEEDEIKGLFNGRADLSRGNSLTIESIRQTRSDEDADADMRQVWAMTCVTIMSFFNTDVICMDCSEKERKHPSFEEARKADEAQIAQKNFNFKGIGKPSDL